MKTAGVPALWFARRQEYKGYGTGRETVTDNLTRESAESVVTRAICL